MGLRRQWWRIRPVRHHLLQLNSQPIHTSWGTIWSLRSRYISGERLVWTLVAMVQFATLWRVVILDPRIAKFHYPRRNFLSGFFYFDQNCGVVSLTTMSCFLVLSSLQFLFAFFRFVLLLD
jgi:hypothetical protein